MFVKELGNTAGVPSVYTLPVCMLGKCKRNFLSCPRKRKSRIFKIKKRLWGHSERSEESHLVITQVIVIGRLRFVQNEQVCNNGNIDLVI